MNGNRIFRRLPALWIAMSVAAVTVGADEHPPVPSGNTSKTLTTSAEIIEGFRDDLRTVSKALLSDDIQLAPQPRVSRSFRPLRRVTSWGGDRFDAELMTWENDVATLRLQNGQTVRIPTTAVAAIQNPPEEVDLLDESFETGSSIESIAELRVLIDDQVAADGEQSLRFGLSSPGYQCRFPQVLATGRLEFAFRARIDDPSADCGEWKLEWTGDATDASTITIRIGTDRRIRVVDRLKETESSTQSLAISDGWHSFIAIVNDDRTRLIVDDAILASFPTPRVPLHSIRFGSGKGGSSNALWIDALQLRRFVKRPKKSAFIEKDPANNDRVILATDDELFGKLKYLQRTQVTLHGFGAIQSLPWTQLTGLAWQPPQQPVQQLVGSRRGVVSQIEMQPYVDRPDQPAQQLNITILKSDSGSIIVQHCLLGELTIPWSAIRSIRSSFFGESILLDARRFHLGNSIRDDFHRDLPDGTELTTVFHLQEIPPGRASLSVDVAELEAAGPMAPPGSPFLTELRAGELITEATVNEHSIGSLNSKIQFKASCQNPDRIRLQVPTGLLKTGTNTLRLRQKPRKQSPREFDDGEVGHFRLEFDLTEITNEPPASRGR